MRSFSLKPRPAGLAPTLASLLLFAGLCAIAAYWAIVLSAPRASIAPAALPAERGADLGPAASLFGTPREAIAVQAAAASNIQVIGLAAADTPRSVALLAVDGRPARPFAVGDQVSDGVRLIAVSADKVTIDRAGVRIDLPAPARPSLAVLSGGASRPRDSTASPIGASRAVPPAAMPAAAPAPSMPPPPGAGQPQPGFAPSQVPPGMPPPSAGVVPSMPPPSSAVVPSMPMPGTVTGTLGAPGAGSPDGAPRKP